jgi:hypothetical protein
VVKLFFEHFCFYLFLLAERSQPALSGQQGSCSDVPEQQAAVRGEGQADGGQQLGEPIERGPQNYLSDHHGRNLSINILVNGANATAEMDPICTLLLIF